MRNYTNDPNWYKKVKKDEIWVLKSNKKNLYKRIKILSVINFNKRKAIKVECSPGHSFKVAPGWVFYNYEKEIK